LVPQLEIWEGLKLKPEKISANPGNDYLRTKGLERPENWVVLVCLVPQLD
jgi:hypothetical protein